MMNLQKHLNSNFRRLLALGGNAMVHILLVACSAGDLAFDRYQKYFVSWRYDDSSVGHSWISVNRRMDMLLYCCHTIHPQTEEV